MRKVLLKSTLVTLLCVVASVLAAATVVPALGGIVDGNAWMMCVVCPLVTAFPASTYTFWQGARLRRAHDELAHSHAQLAAAHAALAERARRDDMTGMLNREAFFSQLEATRGTLGRGILLIIDADHFKSINDTFGHPVGDAALLEIAAAIAGGVRAGDVVSRIGGEEFAVLLPKATAVVAASIAERIRGSVERIDFRPGSGPAIRLTVSVGGVRCPPDAETKDLVRMADEKLYAAKNAGRNRVELDRSLAVAA